ncbi:unnamed protein product [Closterium sp. NIES-53]
MRWSEFGSGSERWGTGCRVAKVREAAVSACACAAAALLPMHVTAVLAAAAASCVAAAAASVCVVVRAFAAAAAVRAAYSQPCKLQTARAAKIAAAACARQNGALDGTKKAACGSIFVRACMQELSRTRLSRIEREAGRATERFGALQGVLRMGRVTDGARYKRNGRVTSGTGHGFLG